MNNKIKILASGGGTVSHTIPLLEVLKKLDKKKFEILYLVSENGPESELVKGVAKFQKILVSKIFRSFNWRNLINVLKNIVGLVQTKIIFLSYKPDLVICKGGYVTLPIIFWSIIFKKDLIVHESDSVLGLANRLASRRAKKILTAFDKKYYPKKLTDKIEVCGIPLRNEFIRKNEKKSIQKYKNILVIGGSQGAQSLNNFVVNNLEKFIQNEIKITHIWGEKNAEKASQFNAKLSEKQKKYYNHYLFVKSGLAKIIADSDLVISRSGATIMAELSVLKKATVFVPYPFASQNHQEKNGKIITDTKAGLVVHNDQLENKVDQIIKLLDDKQTLTDYKNNIEKIMPKRSTEKFIQIIEEVINVKK